MPPTAEAIALSVLPKRPKLIHRFVSGDRGKLRAHAAALVTFFRGRAPNTQRAYAAALRQFFGSVDWIPPEKVTAVEAAAFKRAMKRTGRQDTSTYVRLSVLTSYFKHLAALGIVRENPFKKIDKDEVMPAPPEKVPTADAEIFRTLYEAIPADQQGLRDRAVLALMALGGLGREELASLRVGDLKNRTIPAEARGALDAYWLATGRISRLQDESAVVSGVYQVRARAGMTDDQPLNDKEIRRILLRIARHAELVPMRATAFKRLPKDPRRARRAAKAATSRILTMTPRTLPHERDWLIPEIRKAIGEIAHDDWDDYERRWADADA